VPFIVEEAELAAGVRSLVDVVDLDLQHLELGTSLRLHRQREGGCRGEQSGCRDRGADHGRERFPRIHLAGLPWLGWAGIPAAVLVVERISGKKCATQEKFQGYQFVGSRKAYFAIRTWMRFVKNSDTGFRAGAMGGLLQVIARHPVRPGVTERRNCLQHRSGARRNALKKKQRDPGIDIA